MLIEDKDITSYQFLLKTVILMFLSILYSLSLLLTLLFEVISLLSSLTLLLTSLLTLRESEFGDSKELEFWQLIELVIAQIAQNALARGQINRSNRVHSPRSGRRGSWHNNTHTRLRRSHTLGVSRRCPRGQTRDWDSKILGLGWGRISTPLSIPLSSIVRPKPTPGTRGTVTSNVPFLPTRPT